MKKTRLIILFIMLTQWSIAQITYTANNNPGAVTGVNIFTGATALQDAIAAASAGDIIYVVRGANDYGAVTIDKQLTIFGVGLNPDTNGSTRSIVSSVTIADPVASNTRISGLWITTILNLGGTAGALNNLLIENSNIFRIDHVSATTTLSTLIIRNNLLGNGNTVLEEAISLLPGAIASVVIANNIIIEPTTAAHGNGSVKASNGAIIENNLFVGFPSTVRGAFEGLTGSSVRNNIFYGSSPNYLVSSCTFENNISYNTGNATTDMFSTTSGNISIGNMESLNPQLVNVGFASSHDLATLDPSLIIGSPAIAAGIGGTDMGVTGGGTPFNFIGSPLPLVQEINAPFTISQGSDLPINIKGSGN